MRTTAEEYAILSYNVAWLRRKHGLSKKKMAACMGIGVASLNTIENGKIPERLKISAILKIYKHFGLTPHMLLTKRLGE